MTATRLPTGFASLDRPAAWPAPRSRPRPAELAQPLETLPGVGPSTAQAIIEYRTEHGRFRSVDDLLNVRGIGPAKLGQIKPHARV